MTSPRKHSSKVLSTPACNTILAMVTDLWRHVAYNLREAWHTVYAMLISNYNRHATRNSYNGRVLFS